MILATTLTLIAMGVFWCCTLCIAFVYLGYPLTLLFLPRHACYVTASTIEPPLVTIVIAAHNEEQAIGRTIENKLQIDYPRERFEIIVVSDGSTDRTDEIVSGFAAEGVQSIRLEPRQGKTAALNCALERAFGDIIVFSDANSLYDRGAVSGLTAAFADPSVGYATGLLVHTLPDATAVGRWTNYYLQYENWIRLLETNTGSVVGVNGGIDAVRRSLYIPMRHDQLPDFVLPLQVVEQGYRVVFCPKAVAREEALSSVRDEFKMRVRVSLRAFYTLAEYRHLLSMCRGLFAYQLAVHKLMRYLVFVPLIGLAASSLVLIASPFYRALFCAQLVFYCAAAIGLICRGRTRSRWLLAPLYFSLVNSAAAVALVKFLRGDSSNVWTPRKGI